MEEILTLRCPNCRLAAEAVLESPYHKFIVYTCPKCHSNVAYFKKRVDILPDHLFKKLLSKKKLSFCGSINFPVNKKAKIEDTRYISGDDIVNLRILLETEKDSSRIISRL